MKSVNVVWWVEWLNGVIGSNSYGFTFRPWKGLRPLLSINKTSWRWSTKHKTYLCVETLRDSIVGWRPAMLGESRGTKSPMIADDVSETGDLVL